MTANRKKMGAILLSILLTACQAGRHPSQEAKKLPAPTAAQIQQAAEKQCHTSDAASHDVCLYYAKMQYGIQRNFYHAAHYKGRECAVTITWQNGRYSVLSTAGDEALCLKTWSVISSAENLPPPPKQIPPKMVIDFKPQ
ncbi:hypothetical protein EHW64_06140 [Erwinia psidii]|uniref:cell envelope integrity TolA C-terminal domain-containing protein n=1 Tax=Erwinia psidii TaxID=69224 RepID=UPI00226B2E5A|nr:cell envelope integrity TolA C-terminal domain-containing protein [Erwinia psidii]MCX8960762.1 hypothetical protein [Erwinia psidii]